MKTQKTRIEFEWNNKPIVLEYTADSLKKMQSRGFNVAKADEQLLTLGEDLFVGAFIANHDDIKVSERREIYKELCEACENADEIGDNADANTIVGVCAEMFKEAVEELNSHRGNVKWKVTR